MEITQVPLGDLKPYKNNPRNNDEAVDVVAQSIKDFGFKVPIVIDADYNIITGHTRYKAAKQLGMDEVPCIVADDLSSEQVKAFRLVDNRVGEIATWDLDKLELELDSIDLDLDFFDFDLIDLDDGDHSEQSDDYDDEDDFEFSEPKPKDGKPLITCPKCGFTWAG